MLMVSPGTSSVSPCWSWTMPAYSSKVCAASTMSTRDSSRSLPICLLSSRAKSSARSRRSAAALVRISARSIAFIFGHGPLSKASRAARTARSASATPPARYARYHFFGRRIDDVVGLAAGRVGPAAVDVHLVVPDLGLGYHGRHASHLTGARRTPDADAMDAEDGGAGACARVRPSWNSSHLSNSTISIGITMAGRPAMGEAARRTCENGANAGRSPQRRSLRSSRAGTASP